MDDGIELNFAPASGGIRKPAVAKAGRWTDRAKAKQDVRKIMKKASVAKPAPAPAAPPAPRATAPPPPPPPAVTRPSPKVSASHHAPPVTAPIAGPSTAPARTANGGGSAKGKERAAAVPSPSSSRTPATRVQESPVSMPKTLLRDSAPGAPTSRSAAPAKSKPPQIISSLFSYNPSTSSSAPVTSASAPGIPSNAPLASDNSTFAGLGLAPLLVRHLKGKMSLEKPTGIQSSALPYMLSSPLSIERSAPDEDEEEDYETLTAGPSKVREPAPRDVFIQSQTGSGKTLTYLLPIIQTLLPLSRLSYIDRSIGTLAIILAPTRELAQQISKVLDHLLSLSLAPTTEDPDEAEERPMTRWLVSGLLTGGATKNHEKHRLRKGVPILVATPGRLLDHLQNTASFNSAKTMFLVLDEADRLMDLGFEETIQGIIKALDGRRRIEMSNEGGGGDDTAGLMKWPYWNRGRQTVLCSATVDAKVEKLAGIALRDPIVFRADPSVPAPGEAKEKPFDPKVAEALSSANAVVLPTTGEDKFTPPSQLSQKFVVVPTKLRLVSLVALLRSLVSAKGKDGVQGTKIIVFLSSTDAVDFHWKLLGGVKMGEDETPVDAADVDGMESADEDGDSTRKSKPKKSADAGENQISLSSPLFPSTTIHRLHGSLPLRTRMSSLSSFSSPSPAPSILLATSVASRGLDLPLVRAVVQYDLPTEGGANEYVHRVGRTARAGKGGEAWAFVGPSEEAWIPWVEGKMGAAEGKGVRLGRDSVEDVLRRGFGGKSWEYEGRATEVQMAFERWILADESNASLARKAFGSYVRAYSTHPLEEKRFFHPKSIHLGHLAKSFALRETPGSLASKAPAGKAAEKVVGNDKKRKRPSATGNDQEEDGRKGGKESTARNETEKRMYEAVRKAGRAVRSGGKMGEFQSGGVRAGGGGGSEFQVVGTSELEKMVAGR